MVRQGRSLASVRAFLIGCAVLLVIGCAGVRSEAPKEQEQARSPEATAPEQARCEGTRTVKKWGAVLTTNDLPGCPKGGPLEGTDGQDQLDGKDGEDEVRGLGGSDVIFAGAGNDVVHGGPGRDSPLDGGEGDDVVYGGDGDDGEIYGGEGADVLVGGDGNDFVFTKGEDRQPDKLYCGEGKDTYEADKNDFVSSSCEEVAEWTVIY